MQERKEPPMKFCTPRHRAMRAYVPGEQPQVGKFIKLNTNENPYPPSEKVVQAIRQAARQRPDSVSRPARYRLSRACRATVGRCSGMDSLRQRQ